MQLLRPNIHKETQPPNLLQQRMQTIRKTRKKKTIQLQILQQKQKKITTQIPRHQDHRTHTPPRPKP